MLLLMFFFLTKAFFLVLVALFCLAAFQAVGVVFAALLDMLAYPRLQRSVNLPCLGTVPLTGLLATAPALVVVLIWAAFQSSTWAWVLQDFMGVALMALILRQCRLPSLKVASILLPLCFLYDVFWVFIQPLLTKGGTSVMIEVASGGAAHERIPMLIIVPSFFGLPGYTMLGFGDIVLPGLLIVYTRLCDCTNALQQSTKLTSWQGYFVPTVCAYAIGLLLTYGALLLDLGGRHGQPALLYLPFWSGQE
ncbi:hypothetical protein WJX73_010358 [Symbiochloris irregularis]|uniref:Signal peptide peptidase-like 3 n=1 Tax=Symbiochloris irregularis TaxID=706552 RepID=A0AAW1NN16_9CHLO